jgi:Helix-turn-helix domain
LLTLKAPETLVAELESFARERGKTRHAAALEAIKAGLAALRTRGDTRGDTGAGFAVIPPVIPDAEALANLVAEKVVARLAKVAPWPLPAPSRPVTTEPATEGPPAPESLSGRARKGAPGAVPRRPGDYRIGGHRKADPPEGSVAALLLVWRKARGLSQDAAAEAFGVARKTWGRWETGERYPEAAVVERIKAEV